MAQNIPVRSIKAEHFANLVVIAYADDFLNEDEKSFLCDRAEDYGLSKEEVQDMVDNVEELKFIVPLSQDEKEEQIADIVYMAMIDGHVHQKEYDLCLRIAQKLDYAKKDLDYMIDLTQKLWKGQSTGQD